MPEGFMAHEDDDYIPRVPKPRAKPRHIPRAAKPQSIEDRLRAIERQAVMAWHQTKYGTEEDQ